MASYRLSPNADADLKRIWFFGLEKWGATKADEYLIAMFQRFSILAENPYQSPKVDEVRYGYRRSVFGSDSIYFRLTEDYIEIMAIIGSQDLDKWV